MPSVVALSHRLVLKLTGNDVRQYLQRLVTVDVQLLNNKGLKYAFLLNARGRIVEDIFLLNHNAESRCGVLLECGRQNYSRFLSLLKHYVMHKDVCIEPTNYNVYFIQQSDQKIVTFDPRVPLFGGRVFARQTPDGEVRDLSFYHHRRYEFGIPEGDEIYGRVPVFCNGDLMNGISSNKGCYIGQETTTLSMSNVVRQRILPFTCNGIVSGLLRKGANNVVGSIVACDEKKGLAMIKLKTVLQHPIELNADNGAITAFIPEWWPNNVKNMLNYNGRLGL